MRRLIFGVRCRVALVLASTSACYTYVPVQTPPGPGALVRVELNEGGSRSLAPVLGPQVASVDGRVVSVADTGVRLAVDVVHTGRGAGQRWEGEGTVLVPPSGYREVRRRALSRRRTALLAGAVALGVAVLVSQGLGSDGGGGGPGPGPPPPPP